MNADELSSEGTYVKAVPSAASSQKIGTICQMLNIENAVPAADLHTTVAYSRVVFPTDTITREGRKITANGVGFEVFEGSKERCLVVLLESSELSQMFNECMKLGATYDYPEYRPHITLSYDYQSSTVPSDDVLQYFKNITFNSVVAEKLDLTA